MGSKVNGISTVLIGRGRERGTATGNRDCVNLNLDPILSLYSRVNVETFRSSSRSTYHIPFQHFIAVAVQMQLAAV